MRYIITTVILTVFLFFIFLFWFITVLYGSDYYYIEEAVDFLGVYFSSGVIWITYFAGAYQIITRGLGSQKNGKSKWLFFLCYHIAVLLCPILLMSGFFDL